MQTLFPRNPLLIHHRNLMYCLWACEPCRGIGLSSVLFFESLHGHLVAACAPTIASIQGYHVQARIVPCRQGQVTPTPAHMWDATWHTPSCLTAFMHWPLCWWMELGPCSSQTSFLWFRVYPLPERPMRLAGKLMGLMPCGIPRMSGG